MTGGYAFYFCWAAFAAYAGLLAVAAATDLCRFVIPNFVSAALLLLFFPVALLVPAEIPWLSHIGAAAACFAITIGFYALGWFGAGDVKLLSAVSLWAGFALMPALLVYMSVVGGVLILVLLAVRCLVAAYAPVTHVADGVMVPRLFVWGQKVPYGVAIAGGALISGLYLPYLWAAS